jgi:diguanylate cyclase (GGDEF)-like protein
MEGGLAMASTVIDILWAPLLAGLGVFVGWWLRHWAENSSARSRSTRPDDADELSHDAPKPYADRLTGLSGRAPFVADVKRHVAELKRGRSPVSVLLVRVDNLDELIDRRGTQGAEEMLVAVSRFLVATIRDMDYVARYDDRVFGLILPGADETIARGVVDRLSKILSSGRLPSRDGELSVSISLGAVQAQEDESADQLLARARSALDHDSNKFHHVFCAN